MNSRAQTLQSGVSMSDDPVLMAVRQVCTTAFGDINLDVTKALRESGKTCSSLDDLGSLNPSFEVNRRKLARVTTKPNFIFKLSFGIEKQLVLWKRVWYFQSSPLYNKLRSVNVLSCYKSLLLWSLWFQCALFMETEPIMIMDQHITRFALIQSISIHSFVTLLFPTFLHAKLEKPLHCTRLVNLQNLLDQYLQIKNPDSVLI